MDSEASTSQAIVFTTNAVVDEKNVVVNGEDEEMDCNDDDDGHETDDEFEETYLYVDFETKLLEEQLMNPNLQLKVLGIDTDAPIVQLNNKIFKGLAFCTYSYSRCMF